MSGESGENQETLDGLPLGERHQRLEELGRGGMGVVYKARDRETGEIVALKVLRPEIAADNSALERFKNELRLARKITHKNVCRIHEFHRTTGSASISMEYVEGESLRRLLSRPGGISARFARSILQQVMAGLAEAHKQGVTHRDLKPENIMVAADGAVKVMDFGIARSAEGGTTLPGVLIGTPAYMSPEQAEGRPADARSDLYALGLILYEMFTGEQAFRAETPVALAMKQVHETPPPARRLEPYLPEALDRAIQRCLEKDPKNRYQSVAELEAALNAPPVTVTAATPEEEIAPPAHLSRWSRADTALLALGLAGALFFLRLRDQVFPASWLRLEIDASGARRVAGELANRLGRSQMDMSAAEVQLDLRREMFTAEVQRSLLTQARAPVLEPLLESTLVWRLRRHTLPQWFRTQESLGDINFLLNHRGRLESLHIPGWAPAGYQPRSLEETRATARRAAELACGPLPPRPLTESLRGDAYEASFPGPGARVALAGETVTDLRCRAPTPLAFRGPVFLLWVSWAVVTLAVLLMFAFGQVHQVPYVWRRLPAGILLGCALAWVMVVDFLERPDFEKWVSLPGWPLFALAFADSVLVWIALVTGEHYLRRRDPDCIAAYVQLWRGRLAQPAIGLAVLRGSALAMLVLALETAAPLASRQIHDPVVGRALGVIVDPAPVAQAILSGSPAGFTLAAALLDGFLVALVFLGLLRALAAPRLRSLRGWRRVSEAIGFGGIWVLTGQRLHLASFVPIPMGDFFLFLLEALFLAWVLDRYDVLTVAAAVGTTVLWTINYPLLVTFSEIGNEAQWAVFVAWGALLLVAAWVAFRASLGEAQSRLQAALR